MFRAKSQTKYKCPKQTQLTGWSVRYYESLFLFKCMELLKSPLVSLGGLNLGLIMPSYWVVWFRLYLGRAWWNSHAFSQWAQVVDFGCVSRCIARSLVCPLRPSIHLWWSSRAINICFSLMHFRTLPLHVQKRCFLANLQAHGLSIVQPLPCILNNTGFFKLLMQSDRPAFLSSKVWYYSYCKLLNSFGSQFFICEMKVCI